MKGVFLKFCFVLYVLLLAVWADSEVQHGFLFWLFSLLSLALVYLAVNKKVSWFFYFLPSFFSWVAGRKLLFIIFLIMGIWNL